jgi:predicted transposase YbfD/YdcC
VKGNQPNLLKNCQIACNSGLTKDINRSVEKGHGRIEIRETKTYRPPDFLNSRILEEWSDNIEMTVKQSRVRKVKNISGWDKSKEDSYYVVTRELSAEEASEAVRLHWSIENSNHYVRDEIMGEDKSRIRVKPENLSLLRSIGLNIMRMNKVKNISNEIYSNCCDARLILKYKGFT